MGSLNIYAALSIARQGMMAQQAGLSVTGQNVANANTEGYSRRTVALGSLPGPPVGGGGVEIVGIKRYADVFANLRLIAEQSMLGRSEQQASLLSQVSAVFNDMDDAGLGSALDQFWSSVRALQTSPGEDAARREVLARGAELATVFNQAAERLLSMKSGVDGVLRSAVDEVNQRCTQLADLNADVLSATVRGQDLSDLYDRRDQLVREIAEYVSVSYAVNDKDQMILFMEGGKPLVEGDICCSLRVPAGAAAGMAAVEYVTPSGAASDVTTCFRGGAVGGALEVRDTRIPEFEGALDSLAYDLAGAFNSVHQAGYGLDAVGGRDFFAPLASVAGAARLLSLDAAVDGNPDAVAAALDPAMLPGDNGNAIALAELADQALASGGTVTFNEAYASLVADVGIATRRADREATSVESTIAAIEGIRDSVAGVSLDEEMSNLILYQRAYQASSRVLSAIDEAISSLLEMR